MVFHRDLFELLISISSFIRLNGSKVKVQDFLLSDLLYYPIVISSG